MQPVKGKVTQLSKNFFQSLQSATPSSTSLTGSKTVGADCIKGGSSKKKAAAATPPCTEQRQEICLGMVQRQQLKTDLIASSAAQS